MTEPFRREPLRKLDELELELERPARCSCCGELALCVAFNFNAEFCAARVCVAECWPKLVRLVNDSARGL